MDPYILATSAINIASDFSILFLPVFAVWKLQIALKRKMTISAVFGTGLLWVLPRYCVPSEALR